jgi:2-methylcitrate dehydratase PrpD
MRRIARDDGDNDNSSRAVAPTRIAIAAGGASCSITFRAQPGILARFPGRMGRAEPLPAARAATAEIAAFVADAAYRSIPAAVVARAKDSFLDTLGIAIAGAVEPGGRIALQYATRAAGAAQASLIGGDMKVPARAAAAANGTLAHIVGFSDFSVPNVLHPSVAVLPAVWAMGEAQGADGKALIVAHVAGIEVSCKIGRILTPAFTQRGFHPCAVVGTFGAAAASAKLARLDAEKTASALGIAGVRAAGIKVSLGTMSKAYAVGNAAEGGVAAAELAALGFTGATDVLEGRDGFFQTFGAGVAPAGLSPLLGRPYEFEAPGITIKPYPACTRSHPAIDAALQIAAQGDFAVEDIDAIECEVAPAVLQVVKVADPRNPMEAKFSLPFCLSAALVERKVVMETFSDATLGDPRVQALMKRVRPRAVPALAARGDFAARVTVRLKDGATHAAATDRNLWDAPGVAGPEKRRQLLDKYASCAGRVLGDRAIRETIAIVDALEEERSMERLMRIVRAAAH